MNTGYLHEVYCDSPCANCEDGECIFMQIACDGNPHLCGKCLKASKVKSEPIVVTFGNSGVRSVETEIQTTTPDFVKKMMTSALEETCQISETPSVQEACKKK